MNIILDSRNDIPEYGLRFHSSWDWIMQVVEKIETDGSQETGHNEIHITENTCEIFRMSYVKPQFKNFDNKSKINAVWKTVVQYIQWYNTHIIQSHEEW